MIELAPDPAAAALPPDKLYFKIGEAAEIVGVAPHVLRYWEQEFSFIRPHVGSSRHRRFRRKDVEFFLEIRRLLYQEMYTIAGARKLLHERLRPKPPAPQPEPTPELRAVPRASLDRARAVLHEILALVRT